MWEWLNRTIGRLSVIGLLMIVSGFIIDGMYGAVIAASGAGTIAGVFIGDQMDGAAGTVVGLVGGWFSAMSFGWLINETLGGLIGGVVGAFIGMFLGGVMESLNQEKDTDWFFGVASGGISGVLGGLFAFSYIGDGLLGASGLIVGGGIGAVLMGIIGGSHPPIGVGILIGTLVGLCFESVLAVLLGFLTGLFLGFLVEKVS
ncbi:MAG: hypothetical protein V5A66_03920 [Candidatus Thermoplasmatota archaeon]